MSDPRDKNFQGHRKTAVQQIHEFIEAQGAGRLTSAFDVSAPERWELRLIIRKDGDRRVMSSFAPNFFDAARELADNMHKLVEPGNENWMPANVDEWERMKKENGDL